MKKVLKSAVFWILVVEISVMVILRAAGFRITYNPKLIIDWEAVGAVAGWVSAIATICIPIVAVFFQNKLEQNKKEIGDANKATLAEVKKFKDKYSDILQELGTNSEVFIEKEDISLDFTDQNLIDYICASINITAYDAAMYFDIKKDQAIAKLDSLVEQKLVFRTDIDGIGVYALKK